MEEYFKVEFVLLYDCPPLKRPTLKELSDLQGLGMGSKKVFVLRTDKPDQIYLAAKRVFPILGFIRGGIQMYRQIGLGMDIVPHSVPILGGESLWQLQTRKVFLARICPDPIPHISNQLGVLKNACPTCNQPIDLELMQAHCQLCSSQPALLQ